VQVRATLGNPNRRLLPGMYAAIDIDIGAPQHHITLPQTAIAYNPYGSTVFLVEHQGAAQTARQTFVTTGETRGDQVAVLSGVKEGDVVVTSGQMKPQRLAGNDRQQRAATSTPRPHPRTWRAAS
jgi:membrane fusion protein (multidrug efflux system)